MGNMSYCKFENTLGDLAACEAAIEDDDLSASEKRARARLIRSCRRIVKIADEHEGLLEKLTRDED
jgi:Na+/phosphate symporter